MSPRRTDRPAPLFDLPAVQLAAELGRFAEFGRASQRSTTRVVLAAEQTCELPTFVNEFWTSRQRAAHSLHEVSYRACFKPQLPRFFVERLTRPGEVVYDPFMGRGTTPLEAALLGRRPIGCDINPLSTVLAAPRLQPPELPEVAERLRQIDWRAPAPASAADAELRQDLLAFFHPHTLAEIEALRGHLRAQTELDRTDAWIQMVAINRLTGHSPGFFSVYTLPPNQAVTAASQRRINQQRDQTPPRRDVAALILRKSRSLLRDVDAETRATLARCGAKLLCAAADATAAIADGEVALVVTSPPFLDVVDYATDNWLRGWFLGVDAARVPITRARRIEDWQQAMARVFAELYRVVRNGGHVAFEVGEVRRGAVLLEQVVVPVAAAVGFEPALVQINDQHFTKTAHCWGITNRSAGTNTNRIVVLRR